MKNKAVRMPMTMGKTGTLGLMICKPSIEDRIVSEGVITPSASKAAPPIIAIIYAHFALRLIRAKRLKIPPSPLLSALKVIKTYLTVV
jgi:hypothetical protein